MSGTEWFAAPYVRQSRRKANKSEASPEDQRHQTSQHIASLPNTRLVGAGLYEDIGVSGYDPNKPRKGFERLMADCRAGRVNMIVVHYASRFSRQDTNIVLRQMLELFSLGVRIISVNEGEFKADNVMDLMTIIIRFEASHNESRNKSIAVRGTFERARAAGGWVGGHAPYGFTAVKSLSPGGIAIHTLVPHTTPHSIGPKLSESDVIRMMWEQIKPGIGTDFPKAQRNPHSLSAVAKMLNDNGIPCRGALIGGVHANAKWSTSTVTRCLRDPRLAGYQAERIGRDGHQYRIMRDSAGEPLRADYTPILAPADWWELQGWLEKRGQKRGEYRQTSLLSGLRTPDGRPVLMCAGCDKPMCSYTPSESSTAFASGANYRCNHRDTPGHKGNNTMVQHHLDDHVARSIFGRLMLGHDDPEFADVVAEATRRYGMAVEPTADLRERTRLVTERAEAARAVAEAQADYKAAESMGPTARRAVLESLDRAETRLMSLDGALRALEDAQKPSLPFDLWGVREDGEHDPLAAGGWWDSADLEKRRTFVELFVDRIEIRKSALRGNRWKTYDASERVTITWAGEANGEYMAAA